MSRYINSLPIEKELEERFNYFFNKSHKKFGDFYKIDEEMQTAAILTKDCLDRIRETPTADVVEVVRCKDCIYYEANCCFNSQWDMESSPEVPMVRETDYCSYGERREE